MTHFLRNRNFPTLPNFTRTRHKALNRKTPLRTGLGLQAAWHIVSTVPILNKLCRVADFIHDPAESDFPS